MHNEGHAGAAMRLKVMRNVLRSLSVGTNSLQSNTCFPWGFATTQCCLFVK